MNSSPSRNPLLSREDVSSSEDDENDLHDTILDRNSYIATSHSSAAAAVSSRESQKKRNQGAPVDQYNFAYVVFYILGM